MSRGGWDVHFEGLCCGGQSDGCSAPVALAIPWAVMRKRRNVVPRGGGGHGGGGVGQINCGEGVYTNAVRRPMPAMGLGLQGGRDGDIVNTRISAGDI